MLNNLEIVMRKEILKLILVSTTLISVSGCSMFGVATTEEAKYQIISKEKNYSVREYSPVMIASVTVKNEDYSDASSKGFRVLFKYIGGNNISQEKISMTAPVVSTPESQDISMTAPVFIKPDSSNTWTVSFVMPANFTPENTPKPKSDDIKISQRSSVRVAVLEFSGLINDRSIEENTKNLEKWVVSQDMKIIGTPIVAGYNPPWTLPFLRRNEIQIPIEK
ncbi:MAG: hypothetical protein ACJA0H_002027 [Francisellaceae bacterium]|jgi:hypothetical protein